MDSKMGTNRIRQPVPSTSSATCAGGRDWVSQRKLVGEWWGSMKGKALAITEAREVSVGSLWAQTPGVLLTYC